MRNILIGGILVMFYMKMDRVQVYLDWIRDKMQLHLNAPSSVNRIIKRGEVYVCRFGRNIGSEQEKTRPCVILQVQSQNDKSPNTIVAPITHTSSTLDVVVPIKNQYDKNNNVILDGHVLLGNIVTISKSRLDSYITKLPKDEMDDIDIAILKSLGIHEKFTKLENKYRNEINHVKNLNKKIDSLEAQLKQ